MKEKIRTDRFRILSWGGVAFFTLLYASLIFNRNVWTDEREADLDQKFDGIRFQDAAGEGAQG